MKIFIGFLLVGLNLFAAPPLKPAKIKPVQKVEPTPLQPVPSVPGSSPSIDPPLSELFGIQNDPGRGVISVERDKKKSKFSLGKGEDHYGVGFVFELSRLPTEIKAEFGQSKVLQFIVGTKPEKLAGRMAQFINGMVVTQGLQPKKNVFPLVLPSGQKPKEFSLLLFSAPETLQSDSQEKKLQSTFFGNSGELSVTPLGEASTIEAYSGKKKVLFSKQKMILQMESKLTTPFNPETANIEAKLEIPLYWAKDQAAKVLMDRLARQSLSTLRAAPPRQTSGK